MDNIPVPENNAGRVSSNPFEAKYNQVDRVDQGNAGTQDINPLLAEVMNQPPEQRGVAIPAGSEVVVNGAQMRTGADGTVVIEHADSVVINNNYSGRQVEPVVQVVETNGGRMYDNYPPRMSPVVIAGDRPYYPYPVADYDGQIFNNIRRRGPGNQVYVESDGPVNVSHRVISGPNTRFENTRVGAGGGYVVADNGAFGGWTADHTITAIDTVLNGWGNIRAARHGGYHPGMRGGNGSWNGGWSGGGNPGWYGGDWQRQRQGSGDLVVINNDGPMPNVNRRVLQGPNTRFENTTVGTPPFVPDNQGGAFGGWTGEHTITALDTILNGVAMIKGADNMGRMRHGGGDFYENRRQQQIAESRARHQQRYQQMRVRVGFG